MTTHPTSRLDAWKAAPEVFKAALALESAGRSFNIEPKLLELIKLRASQINGCAHCMNLHFNDAVKAGESPQRLHLLPVWSETPHLYTAAERAVLRWTEAPVFLSAPSVRQSGGGSYVFTCSKVARKRNMAGFRCSV